MSKEANELIKLNGLFFFTLSVASIFVNLFLFQLGGFYAVIKYGLLNLTFLLVIYLYSGYLLKKYSSSVLIRTGLLFFTILYTILLLLGERSINFLIPLGIINGLANGFYWPGINLIQYNVTHEHSRNEYFGKFNFFINIGSAFGPLLGGLIIYLFNLYNLKFFGYIAVFSLVAILFAILFLITNKLPSFAGIQYSSRQILKHKRSLHWKIVLSQQFLYGLFDISFATISTVLIFLFLQQEFIIGVVNTVASIIFAFANILAIRLLKKNKRIYILGTLLATFGLYLFGMSQTWLGIFGLVLLTDVFLPILNIVTSKGIYDTVDSVKEEWKNKYYFLVERDIALGVARILIYAILLILFTPENQTAISKNWILIVPIFPLIIGTLQIYKEKV
ncbi:MFS transporter [Candidatus Daviesbacteria bacterium]|nr:MFS transporter [Candidatus Daviesbacteria bacterium]